MLSQTRPQPEAPAAARPRGRVLASAAALLAFGLAGHRLLPRRGGLATVWEALLPWTAVLVIALAALALLRRSPVAAVGVLVAALVWSAMFLPQVLPSRSAGTADLVVATQNIEAANGSAVAAAQALVASGAQVVAVQEIARSASGVAEVLDRQFPHRVRTGTVGVWSAYPLADPEGVDLGVNWVRGLHVTLRAPAGDVSLYAVHLPSVRPGKEQRRDRGLARLAEQVAADASPRVVVMGDLNTPSTDRSFRLLTGELADSRQSVRGGFGFTWPAGAPLVRLDHVMLRGVRAVSDDVLAANGSDHRAVRVGIAF